MTHFRTVFDAILAAENPLVATHKLLGHTVYGDVPALLADEIFVANGAVCGTPGSGKTAFLIRLVYQQLALNRLLARRELGVRPMSVVILDHKGSRAFYHHVAHMTRLFGTRLGTLSIEPKMPTNRMSWFDQWNPDEVSPMEIAQQLCACLNVAVGDEHGAAYFGASSIVRAFGGLRGKRRPGDFRAFYDALVDPSILSHILDIDQKTTRDSNHLLSQALIASQVHAMNLREGDGGVTAAEMAEIKAHGLDLPSLFRGPPQVYYFYLPAGRMKQQSSMIGRLVLNTLVNKAGARTDADTNNVLVVSDEAHTSLTRSLLTSLELCRELGVTCHWSYQYPGQLKERGADIDEAIEGCCNWFLSFGVPTDEAFKTTRERCLTGPVYRQTWAQDAAYLRPDPAYAAGRTPSETPMRVFREEEDCVYPVNDMRELATNARVAWFWTKVRKGLTQFPAATPLMWDFHVGLEEHRRIIGRPWPPPKGPGQFIVLPNPFPPPERITFDAAPGPKPPQPPAAPPGPPLPSPPDPLDEQLEKHAKKGKGKHK